MTARLAAVLVLAAGTASAGHAQDAIDNPTDTHITLVAGLWHDDDLVPGTGWHLYHFTPDADGPIAFQMRAAPDNHGLWAYLRIVDTSAHNQAWAGIADRKTNLCEVIVDVAARPATASSARSHRTRSSSSRARTAGSPPRSMRSSARSPARTTSPTPQLAPDDDLQRVATRAGAAARIEDPAVHTSATIDCVSCHLAQSLRSPSRPVDVHMFGYQGSTPSIQPRTLRETAASLALVNALLAAR